VPAYFRRLLRRGNDSILDMLLPCFEQRRVIGLVVIEGGGRHQGRPARESSTEHPVTHRHPQASPTVDPSKFPKFTDSLAVDPSKLQNSVRHLTVDPSKFQNSVRYPTVDPSKFWNFFARPTVDPSKFWNFFARPTVDPSRIRNF
jgi:hypothetical protein